MKIHRGLAEATVFALMDIFNKKRQADRVIEQTLKANKKWGARDRNFIAENTYEIVRWWRLVKFVCEVEKAVTEDDFWILFGAWQLIKPIHLKLENSIQLPAWEEFSTINKERIAERYATAQGIRKVFQSVPDWLDETGERELGSAWDQELAALNEQAPVVLRINTLKSSIDEVRNVPGLEDSMTIPEIPNALVLQKRKNLATTDAYKNGFFEVQDAGSQMIASYLDIQPGLSVIDACAGAGGKTLQIAALLENKGSVLAMDIEGYKLVELERRAARNGVKNLDSLVISSEKVIEKLENTADRLLLDVPCSGLGVLRRNPDSKWKLTPEFLENIKNVQWHILSTYSKMLKKGGVMVYATCSLLPSESEKQVEKFIKKYGKEWDLIQEHRTSPFREGYDGFYMASLRRK